MRRKCVTLLLCWALTGWASSASGECIGLKPRDAKKRAAKVFEGVVAEVYESGNGKELAATLDVERVWKGTVRRRITVYFVQSLDGPYFHAGRRVIVFAQPQTPELRNLASLSPDSPHRSDWVPPCQCLAEPREETVKQLGRSRAPRK
jgi:hypothetical protein